MTKSRSRGGAKETWRAAESASDRETRQKDRGRGGGGGKEEKKKRVEKVVRRSCD